MILKHRLIDYELLAKAVEFYRRAGFFQVEVPWMVSPISDSLTRPEGRRAFEVVPTGLNLCASGESGLRERWSLDNHIYPDVDYFTVTPCFRDESPGRELTHSREFMKLELGRATSDLKVAQRTALMYFDNARAFAESIHPKLRFSLQNTGGGHYDLEYQGLELGSYGVRSGHDSYWVYGTGLALPRFSLISPGGSILDR